MLHGSYGITQTVLILTKLFVELLNRIIISQGSYDGVLAHNMRTYMRTWKLNNIHVIINVAYLIILKIMYILSLLYPIIQTNTNNNNNKLTQETIKKNTIIIISSAIVKKRYIPSYITYTQGTKGMWVHNTYNYVIYAIR